MNEEPNLDALHYDIHLDKITLDKLRTSLGLPSFSGFFNSLPNGEQACLDLYGFYPNVLDLMMCYGPNFVDWDLIAKNQLREKIKHLALGNEVEYFEKDGLLL